MLNKGNVSFAVTMGVLVLVFCLLTTGCAQVFRKPGFKAQRAEPEISLYVHETGEKKQIKLEEYLAGVVAAEMEPSWPESALAAQAIVARTFTLKNIEAGRVRNLHNADASTSPEEFQAYDATRINEAVRRAVNLTRGKVITYRNDYIEGWFSSCCGSITASAREGLEYHKTQTPYIKTGVRDNCLKDNIPENRSWKGVFPLQRVRNAVKRASGRDPGVISDVEVVSKGPSGRITQLRVGNVVLSGASFRLALGEKEVRSTLWTRVDVKDNNLILEGKGFGHGVGMCQWGARNLARAGKSPEEIIRFYFRNVEIKKLWD